jgi:hypothetical protein
VRRDEELDDLTVKHLEFIQGVIARLSSDSFLLKGWGLTVAAAFFGFSASNINPLLAGIGLLPVFSFWGLDAYFLSRERLYRVLYAATRARDTDVPSLAMDYGLCKRRDKWSIYTSQDPNWGSSTVSRTLLLFWLPILAVGLALIIFGIVHSAPASE